jgi:hypothetical protein
MGNLKTLNTVEELLAAVDQDGRDRRYDRFPVRLVQCTSIVDYHEILHRLPHEHVRISAPQVFLTKTAHIATSNQMSEKIHAISQTAVVSGFHQYMHTLQPDHVRAAILQLFDIEARHGARYRIIVPVWDCNNVIDNTWFDGLRRDGSQPAGWSVTRTEGANPQQTLFLSYKNAQRAMLFRDCPDTTVVASRSEWIELDYPTTKVLLLPDEMGSTLSLPGLTVIELLTPKDILSRLYGVDISCDFHEEESQYWDTLLEFVVDNKINSFQGLISAYFPGLSLESYDGDSLLSFWLDKQEPQRWLLKQYVLSRTDWIGYLPHVLRSIRAYNKASLVKSLWFSILDIDPSGWNQYNQERRKLLNRAEHRDASSQALNEEIADYLKVIDGDNEKLLMLLTDGSVAEKALIIRKWLEATDSNKGKWLSMFPAFQDYLETDWNKVFGSAAEPWLIDYFCCYQASKAENSPALKLDQMLLEHSGDLASFSRWYRTFPTVEIAPEVPTCFIDGLGLEWSLMFEKAMFERGYEVESRRVCRAALPSTTKENKRDIRHFFEFRELDELAHSEPYQHPRSLISQLSIVSEIVKKIDDSGHKRVQIYTDHGSSAFCSKQAGQSKKYDFSGSHHDGRYIEGKPDFKEDPNLMVWQGETAGSASKAFIISKNHVCLQDTPYREVHGGATPEEVLVPFWVFERTTETSNQAILLSEKITTKDKYLDILFDKRCSQHPIVLCDDRQLIITSADNRKYRIQVDRLSIGEHVLRIQINGKEQALKFHVTRPTGFKENDII